MVAKHPASTQRVFDPKDLNKATINSTKFKNIAPKNR